MAAIRQTEKPASFRPRCPNCGYKIRGDNHAEGDHHKQGKRSRAQRRRG